MLKQFIIVALLSMTPWGEWAVAIPAGLLMDLPFFPILIVAFAGNLLPVLLICVLWQKFQYILTDWQQKRKHKTQSIYKRYGVLGLIFIAPVSVGVYLSSVTALLTGISARRTIFLHMYCLAFWGAAISILYLLGLKAWGFLAL